MSEKVVSVIDFSDLAEEVKFKFSGVVYKVPPITGAKAKVLFSMSKELQDKYKKVEGKEEEIDNSEFLDYQARFISCSVKTEDNQEISKEDIDNWPIKLQKKVVELVNKQISGVEEDSTEEAK